MHLLIEQQHFHNQFQVSDTSIEDESLASANRCASANEHLNAGTGQPDGRRCNHDTTSMKHFKYKFHFRDF